MMAEKSCRWRDLMRIRVNKLSQLRNKILQRTVIAVALCLALGLSQTAFSAGGGIVTDDTASLSGASRTEPYSPYAQRNFPTMPL
ncbi:MAG: hypothetical protein O7G88_05680, partial [bacterium]|nr:hypothetical protein [bacterium]